MLRLLRFARPALLEDALRRVDEGATPLGGGTRLFREPAGLTDVVDLGASLLRGIHVGERIRLGGAARVEDLLRLRLPAAFHDAARMTSASPMIRNAATIGGEAATPGSPLAILFTALDATIDRTRGVIQGVVAPNLPGLSIQAVRVLPSAAPIVTVAAVADGPAVRIAAPDRIPAAERPADTPDEAGRIAAREVRLAPDWRAGEEYRRHVTGVLVRRAIEEARDRARDGAAPVGSVESRLFTTPYESGPIRLTLNGEPRTFDAPPHRTLMELLRGDRVWSVKHGCESGDCGTCTVLLDGRPVNTCILPAVQAHGSRIETVESLGDAHPIARAFVECGAVQCGYCTPSMILNAKALLDGCRAPTEGQVREALGGCLCRCTGYVKPVQAVMEAARG